MMSKLKHGIFPLAVVLILFATKLTSCTEEEIEAKESVIGEWKVTSIESLYGVFTTNGHNGLTPVNEAGNLGFFNFSESGELTYSFTRNDTLYQNTTEWKLHSTKERVGFNNVTKHKLDVAGFLNFEVMFGDGTKNSARNASEIELTNWPNSPGRGVAIILVLSKQ